MRASFRISLTNTNHSELWLPRKQNENCQQFLQNALPFNVLDMCATHIVLCYLYIVVNLAEIYFLIWLVDNVTRVTLKHIIMRFGRPSTGLNPQCWFCL